MSYELDVADDRCSIFTSFINSGLQASLINTLNPPTTSSEPITPGQTSLLKIIDSHLSDSHPNTAENHFLLPLFHRLQVYANGSFASGIDDARLPKVLEALVLVLEGLGSIGLACQGRRDRHEPAGEEEVIVAEMQAEGGIVGPLVGEYSILTKLILELLKALNAFMPRLRPSPANPVSNDAPTERSLGGIKVSLIRLLGVLSYENTNVGDQVRSHGGIELVLSMTEVDELNPCMSLPLSKLNDRSARTCLIHHSKSYAKQPRKSGCSKRDGSSRGSFRNGRSLALAREDEAGG
jgi:ataxin-10